jgi:hypothetical protein
LNTSKHFLQAFSVVFVSSIVSCLVLLQNDLQACANPAPNIVTGTCVIHWQLIAVAFLTAVISGGVHTLRIYLQSHDAQLLALTPDAPITSAPTETVTTTAEVVTTKKEPT